MDPSVKIIDDILCLKHKQAVKMIVMVDQVPINDRSLCDTCFQEKQEVSKYISITQFQVAIQEKLKKFKKVEEEYKKGFIDDLNQFKSQMSEVKTKILRNIDEILGIAQKWIENLKAIEKQPKTMNLNEGLQYLLKEVKIDKRLLKKQWSCSN